MTVQDAMRTLGLERYDGDIPRTCTVSRRHAPARQAFERFELEHRRRGSYVIQRTRRNRHTAPPVVAEARCNLDASYRIRPVRSRFGSSRSQIGVDADLTGAAATRSLPSA